MQQHDKKHKKSHNTQALQNKIRDEEIQELESQILDMFEVAFHFAGLKPSNLDDALNYYMEVMESQDDDLPYNAQTIIANILLIRQDKPEWFDTLN
ncbi:MAG: hypothetical protein SPJ83_01535 [Helicobacter sp.]|uniref:Uncharacterized protein n=2 Tax=Helicobacter bilis TaxID=37372 RepID=A0A099VA08_9HELI|nr:MULTISPECIES: hypothetical protein [Helicobacter]AQQ59905.1 hypothetical protein XJ32_07185 [Helicobacter bilis]EMZ37285.1 hypothetical protein C826_02147 [Helicobacter bilis WiWa]MCI7411112.1 hypothetical protein [Helicobacter bilis]MDD7296847.1 hypothetical protein [Helicobacter bilis]MDY4400832.1 hypothetical protein [Helicobacter bilis]